MGRSFPAKRRHVGNEQAMSGTGHHHSHGGGDHSEPLMRGKKLAVVIFFNMIITISEYIGGVISGSLSLISDAGHNLSDVLALALGYAGERISEKEPDRIYSFGLKRFEVVVAAVNALALLAIGVFIVYEAGHRYFNPVPINVLVMLPIAAIGLCGNLLSMLVLMRDRHSNLNMKAAFLHLLYDTLSSIAVIGAGIALHFTGLAIIDLAISLVIVIMIAGSSLSIMRDALRIFLQGTPAHIDAGNVYRDITAVPGVGSVHGLHIWSINSSEAFLSCHICVSDPSSSVDSDALIRQVNAMLEECYEIRHTTIQVETTLLCQAPGACCH